MDHGLRDMLSASAKPPHRWRGIVVSWLRGTRILTLVEPLLLVASLPFLIVLPLWLAPLGVGLLAASWGVRWLATGRLSVRSPVDWPVVLLVAMIPITLWWTAVPEVTWRAVAHLVAGLATLMGVLNWAGNEHRVAGALWGLILVGVGLALMAPVSVHWQATAKPYLIPRIAYHVLPELLPDPINPNVMAGALAVILPLPVSLLVLGGRKAAAGVPGLERYPRLACWMLCIACLLIGGVLVLTESRGAYLATCLGMLLVLVLGRRWLAVGLLMAAVVAVAVWSQIGDQAVAGLAIKGWQPRTEIWSAALRMIQDYPLTGIGMGTFNETANAMYPLLLSGPAARVPHAHNLFLQVGVDLGIPGLVAYLALWLVCLRCVWQAYGDARRQGQVGLAAAAAGLGVSLVVLAFHGMLDAVTWATKPAVLAWAVMGMCIALHRVVRCGVQGQSPRRG